MLIFELIKEFNLDLDLMLNYREDKEDFLNRVKECDKDYIHKIFYLKIATENHPFKNRIYSLNAIKDIQKHILKSKFFIPVRPKHDTNHINDSLNIIGSVIGCNFKEIDDGLILAYEVVFHGLTDMALTIKHLLKVKAIGELSIQAQADIEDIIINEKKYSKVNKIKSLQAIDLTPPNYSYQELYASQTIKEDKSELELRFKDITELLGYSKEFSDDIFQLLHLENNTSDKEILKEIKKIQNTKIFKTYYKHLIAEDDNTNIKINYKNNKTNYKNINDIIDLS